MKSRLSGAILPFVFHVILAVVALGANPFSGETVGPFDLLSQQGGFSGDVTPLVVRSAERSDVLDALLPRWIQARSQIRLGNFPIWNPLPIGGERGIQNVTNAELTPGFAIFTIASNPATGFYLCVLFNLSMAGLGCYYWLRRRLDIGAAVFGSSSFMLCGFITAWLFWPHVMTAMWIGWALWATDRLWSRLSVGNFLLVVLFDALMFLGGFPFVTLLGYGAALLYLICLFLRDFNAFSIRRGAAFVLALPVSLALCAVPLMSFLGWFSVADLSYRMGGSPFSLFGDLRYLLPGAARSNVHIESTMYVGTAALVLAVIAWAFVLVRRFLVSPLGLYTFLLGAVGMTLVFEIIPAHYLQWVPGLNNNPWSRAIVILDLALVSGAAYTVNAVGKRLNSRVASSMLIALLLVYQLQDLLGFARLFNGTVPSSYFYPSDPLVSKAARGIKPFQSVLADNNYMVSGTLGAYGLSEWFAHGFNPPILVPALKQLADNPFTTPTATLVEAESFNLASPAMNFMAVRYVLGDSGLLYQSEEPKYLHDVPPRQPLPPMPLHAWSQHFQLDKPYRLKAVGFRLATYNKSGLPGHLSLKVRDSGGSIISQAKLDANTVKDNVMAVFALPESLDLAPGSYGFDISYSDGGSHPITAWYTAAEASNCSLLVDEKPVTGCADVQLMTTQPQIGAFVPVASKGGMYLLENTTAPDGPYFVSGLNDDPSKESSRHVQLQMRRPSKFDIRYDGVTQGYLVMPMHFAKGWHASLNGKSIDPVMYKKVLPAFPLVGKSLLKFRYEPNSIRYGKWVSLATLLLLLLLGATGFTNSRLRKR